MTDYFELYQLPRSFNPDPALVKAKYYELSRTWHPDRFSRAEGHEQAEALRMAALNNDVYKTLSDPDRLMAYLLKSHGLLEDEEKYNLPPAFLMEMMDLNEAVSDYEMQPDDANLARQSITVLAEQFEAWEAGAKDLTDRFDAGDQSSDLLMKIKDMYFRKKYLLRIQERINKFAAR